MSSHVLQDFKSKHNQEDPAKRVIEFSFTLEDSGPDVAWPLDGKPVVDATARISPNGQLLISGRIVEFDDLPRGVGSNTETGQSGKSIPG